MSASLNGHADIVALLLDRGADVNQAKIDDGFTALIFAAGFEHLETMHVLCSQTEIEIDLQTAKVATALLCAAALNKENSVKYLLSVGANPLIA